MVLPGHFADICSLTYAPDVALSNDNVPVTLSSGNELNLGSPYAWFSFQVPTSD